MLFLESLFSKDRKAAAAIGGIPKGCWHAVMLDNWVAVRHMGLTSMQFNPGGSQLSGELDFSALQLRTHLRAGGPGLRPCQMQRREATGAKKS